MRKVCTLLSLLCMFIFSQTLALAKLPNCAKPDTITVRLKNKDTEKLIRSLFKQCKPGTIPYIIDQTFGKSLEQHLSINDFLQMPDSIMAIAIEGNTSLDKYVSSIIINRVGLQNASEPFMVSVLMHELLHIYLKFTRPDSLFNDHEEMASEHITLLMNSMKEVYPQLSKLKQEAYAWGGLSKTKTWSKFIEKNWNKAKYIQDFGEKERLIFIKDNQSKYKNGNAITLLTH
jgi:hypothetical protein